MAIHPREPTDLPFGTHESPRWGPTNPLHGDLRTPPTGTYEFPPNGEGHASSCPVWEGDREMNRGIYSARS